MSGFMGEPINLNVVNADVRDILNYITEQYGINFVIDSSVGAVPVTVILANTGQVDARESRVRVVLSDGATLERSEPPPARQENGALIFDLPALAAGKKQEVALQVRPAKLGSFTVSADVSTADGLQGHREASTRIENGIGDGEHRRGKKHGEAGD